MCSGRVDLEFIFRAFANGQDGVLIGGCRLNDCNYITHGNYDALSNTYISRNIMGRIGLNPERLSIEFMSGGEGNRLAEVVNNFTKKVKDLGPLGEAEGINKIKLKGDLEAVRTLIPYIKLIEREKLRVPVRSEKAYHEFFTSDEVNRLFDDLIGDKLNISRIVALLRKKPLPTGEISEILGIDPSEVTKHMNSSSRQGLVTYDMDSKCYALALGGAKK
jgi:coenzyme F420-reducing hydrogenase delta subunit